MTDAIASTPVLAFTTGLLGLTFGLVYFRGLHRTADLLVGGHSWLRPACLTLARLLGAILGLAFIARLGALPLLASFLGFLLARMIALRSARRAG